METLSPSSRRLIAGPWPQDAAGRFHSPAVEKGETRHRKSPFRFGAPWFSPGDYVRNRANQGYREPGADKQPDRGKKKIVLDGPVDMEAGHEIAQLFDLS
jgi:hypothetical protein